LCIKEEADKKKRKLFVVNREKFIHFLFFTWKSDAHSERSVHNASPMPMVVASVQWEFVRGIQIAVNSKYKHKNTNTRKNRKTIQKKSKKKIVSLFVIGTVVLNVRCGRAFSLQISLPFHKIIMHTRMRELFFHFSFSLEQQQKQSTQNQFSEWTNQSSPLQ